MQLKTRWFSFVKVDRATEVNKGQKLVWDESKVICSLSGAEREDELLLRNIANGSILSSKLWPILIDSIPANSPSRTRSLEFLREFVNAEDTSKCLDGLNSNSWEGLAMTIRDLWLAKHHNLLSTEPDQVVLCNLLDQALDKFENAMAPETEVDLVPVSFCPTRNRKVLRFTHQLDELLDEEHELHGCAAQYRVPGFPKPFIAVWVDPRDLSYHNFENTLSLDRALQVGIDGKLQLEMDQLKRLHPNINIFSGVIKGRDAELLPKLNDLNLYQEPSNSSSRGGQRFVFDSATLSNALTAAVKQSGLLYLLNNEPVQESFSEGETNTGDDADSNSEADQDSIIDADSDNETYKRKKKRQPYIRKSLVQSFRFVNHVIRCNRFQPNDNRFELHRDTPYYDSARSHISKYTMIIYLKGGKGESSILNIFDGNEDSSGEPKSEPDFSLPSVEDMQFVVFEQKYRHEGLPYISGEKVFLRTELIFEEKNVTHNSKLGPLFSSAVYFTTESAFQPEMATYATELYERVNQTHWSLCDHIKQHHQNVNTLPVLEKCYDGVFRFATNGSDYWFPYATGNIDAIKMESDDSTPIATYLRVCALVAVLDYFNGKTEARGTERKPVNPLESFRKKCTSKVVVGHPAKGSSVDQWVLTKLWKNFARGTKKRQASNGNSIIFANSSEKEEVYGRLLREACEESARMPLQSLQGDFPFNTSEKEDQSAKEDDDFQQDGFSEPHCCAFHHMPFDDMEEGYESFRAWKCEDTVQDFTTAANRVLKRLKSSVAFIMDSKLVIDDERILIAEDKIHLGGFEGAKPARINFAACWTEGYRRTAYVERKPWSQGVSFTLPPISYAPVMTEDGKQGFRLMLDFFKNDWMVTSNALKLPLVAFTDENDYIID